MPAGQAEAQEVVAAPHEVGFEQRRQLPADLVRQLFLVERLDRFTGGQVRLFELALDFALQPVVGLGLEEVGEKTRIAPVFGLGAADGIVVFARDGGQPHRAQQQGQPERRTQGGTGGAHEATSASSAS